MPEMKNTHWKYQLKNEILYSSLKLQNNKKICMKKVAGEQGLALQEHFPYKSSKFSEK